MMNPMGIAERRPDVTAVIVAVACAYEVTAILSGNRLPTISRLQFHHRSIGGLVVGWLVWHFLAYEEGKREQLVAEVAAERAVAKVRSMGMLQRPARS